MALVLVSSEGTGMGRRVDWAQSSLGDELAGQVLGRWTSPSARFLEDIVVECGERVTELYPKFVRGHGLGFST